MFDISAERRGGDPRGEIAIGAHREHFAIDFSVWDLRDYRASWLRAAAHVLEHGYGRFLVSVGAPGGSYVCWVCRARGEAALLFKSVLLPSLTCDFATPSNAETLLDDYADRNDDEPNLEVRRCALSAIAEFEARLRGLRVS